MCSTAIGPIYEANTSLQLCILRHIIFLLLNPGRGGGSNCVLTIAVLIRLSLSVDNSQSSSSLGVIGTLGTEGWSATLDGWRPGFIRRGCVHGAKHLVHKGGILGNWSDLPGCGISSISSVPAFLRRKPPKARSEISLLVASQPPSGCGQWASP
jgi:hypothetical protein